MIKISNNSIFYIVCPANYASGGPEDLHQMALALMQSGKKVFMHYLNYDAEKNSSPIHKEYEHYQIPYTFSIENSRQNIMIFPETFSIFIWEKKYSKIQKIIWWLSVSNFFTSLKAWEENFKENPPKLKHRLLGRIKLPTIKNIKKAKIHHLAHSYFSVDFLQKNKIETIGKISGYMEDMFLTGKSYVSQKKDIVTYNAVKNKDFLDKIRNLTPEINWLPMINMTLDEVADCMISAKVYVDFGHHPGREKMPREACLLDCCLIIGKEGSAFFKQDVPIKDEYHFDKTEENIPLIIEKIKDCIANYDSKIKDFADYKHDLLQEKIIFQKKINEIFAINEI
ncbi:hypothetical protein [Chryseobacterium sp. HMWF035]|uniref:hypothetical protein n=1 Tax=Chryseobacterium sp. HMWF035 TaxID=2056868 RepID=UPI000D56EE0D|nr:hypothetical protein [Chryseobacterium sp. HMWF035]PVV60316.1 hypothetical protein DD829_05325 [Chryseobacterium sp. HMWF035]